MTVLRYFLSMLAATILCWAAFALVLFYIDPNSSGWIGILCFYLSMFFALIGTLALIGFGIRIAFWRNTLPYKQVGVSLRQGLLFAILVGCALLLAANDLYTWWSIVLLIAGFGMLELFFLSRSMVKFNKV